MAATLGIGRWRRRLEGVVHGTLAGVLQALPARVRVGVRERLDVVGRLDDATTRVLLAADSLFEYDVRLNSCRKEPGTVRWIGEWLSPGDVLYDVGANVGAYALLAARRWNGRVPVYAFEPAFTNYAQLCRNVFLNRCDASVFPLPVALADTTRLDTFNHRSLVVGSAMHAFGEAAGSAGGPFDPVCRQTALGYRLDDFIAQFGLPAPTHIKIDVDGLEAQVLAGAERTLKDPALRTVLVEMLTDAADEAAIVARLEAAGLHRVSVERFGEIAYNALWARA